MPKQKNIKQLNYCCTQKILIVKRCNYLSAEVPGRCGFDAPPFRQVILQTLSRARSPSAPAFRLLRRVRGTRPTATSGTRTKTLNYVTTSCITLVNSQLFPCLAAYFRPGRIIRVWPMRKALAFLTRLSSIMAETDVPNFFAILPR